ncbi:MAG: NTP transferase domain-containing protein, partial [Proteobacteria bacterium]|nr:NTP transferase domain-containing protein [Pseudomonadota bacterium]
MNGTVLAILCARIGSDRYPGKVLANVSGRTVLEHVVRRLKQAKSVSEVVIATSDKDKDNPICELAVKLKIPLFRGDEYNVAERMYGAYYAFHQSEPFIFRAMSDSPFLDWQALDEAVTIMLARNWDFVLPLTFEADPVYGAGLFPWSVRCWKDIYAHSSGEETEHVGMWLRRNLDKWDYGLRDLPHWTFRPYRLELDTKPDLELIKAIYSAWGKDEPPPLRWVVTWMDKHPGIHALNAHIAEKTGTYTSYTQAEIDGWKSDYAGREVVWSDVAGLIGDVRDSKEAVYRCEKCGGNLVALSIRKGDLQTKCIRCGKKRTFYAVKPR